MDAETPPDAHAGSGPTAPAPSAAPAGPRPGGDTPPPGANVMYVNITPELATHVGTLVTNVWRTHSKLVEPEPRDDAARRIIRHVDAIIEGLGKLGLEIDDPPGRAYDSGFPLKVITFEPNDSLQRLTVVARGAAVFAGTQRIKAGPAVKPEQGKFTVELNYEPVGPDTDPTVRGTVRGGDGVALESYNLEVVNERSRDDVTGLRSICVQLHDLLPKEEQAKAKRVGIDSHVMH